MRAALIFVAVLVGCAKHESSRITTPERIIKCPVCEQEAALWRFNGYEADYNCPNHRLTYRREGYFESASPIEQPTKASQP